MIKSSFFRSIGIPFILLGAYFMSAKCLYMNNEAVAALYSQVTKPLPSSPNETRILIDSTIERLVKYGNDIIIATSAIQALSPDTLSHYYFRHEHGGGQAKLNASDGKKWLLMHDRWTILDSGKVSIFNSDLDEMARIGKVNGYRLCSAETVGKSELVLLTVSRRLCQKLSTSEGSVNRVIRIRPSSADWTLKGFDILRSPLTPHMYSLSIDIWPARMAEQQKIIAFSRPFYITSGTYRLSSKSVPSGYSLVLKLWDGQNNYKFLRLNANSTEIKFFVDRCSDIGLSLCTLTLEWVKEGDGAITKAESPLPVKIERLPQIRIDSYLNNQKATSSN
jgi:hypothetical protein